MIELEQYKLDLDNYNEKIFEMVFHFDVISAKIVLEELELEQAQESFWSDIEHSNQVLKKSKKLKDKLEAYERLETEFSELKLLIEMGLEEQEESIIPDVKEAYEQFVGYYEELRISTLFSGDYDGMNAILTLHAGAGGTESCDWVEMLFRMYSRWADTKNYKMEVLDYLPGEEAGIKSVTMEISGDNAYGYLKSEKGVHRLIRISPFDSSGRRHTSFASCDVMPDIDEDYDVAVNDDELRIDTYRSSGAGGQHVNKTDSAVRITHIPTGIVVQCQNERSQHSNKDRAMKMLKSKLYEIRQLEQREKLEGIRGEVKDNGWGSQIRTYVMHPYSMVKDHRTNEETGNVSAVLDGKIDLFINSYLKALAPKSKTE